MEYSENLEPLLHFDHANIPISHGLIRMKGFQKYFIPKVKGYDIGLVDILILCIL